MIKKEEKLGIYVCHCGGNISDYVDTDKVAEIIGKEPGVHISKAFMFMCSDAGQNMITDDIKAEGLTHVIVASCSPNLHHMTFQKVVSEAGINPYTYRHVNLREQVSWVHTDDEEAATEKSIRLIRGAIAAVVKLRDLSAIQKNMIGAGGIIGGGIAGLNAALDIANHGIPVHLIERTSILGGQTLNLDKLYPTEVSAHKFVDDLIERVNANKYIFVYLNTEVVNTTGTIGDFTLQLQTNGKETQEIHVGTLTIATGFDNYIPMKGEYGYGESEHVITLPDLILTLNSYKAEKLVINGKEISSVGMIHCVGSRQIDEIHQIREGAKLNTNCSKICCTAALQQAVRLKQMFPYLKIVDFYRDIRTYGEKEIYLDQVAKAKVTLVKFGDEEIPQVEIGEKLKISTIDELTYGIRVQAKVDLIVLVTAIVPREKPAIVEDLSLAIGENGFLAEAHVKLQPIESPVDGIFYAGTAQGPKDVKECAMSAAATSAKAVMLLKKDIVEIIPFIAEVNTELCDGNGDCITQCEYHAITLVDDCDTGKKVACVTAELCVSCGACIPACSKKAITLIGYDTNDILGEVRAMIKEVDM